MKNEFPRGIELVTSAIIQNDGKILMTKSPKWADKWILPGGHIEAGETIIESCKREVLEETGLFTIPVGICDSGELVGAKDFHRPAHFVYFDVVLNVISGEIKLEEKELSGFGWFTVDEALELDLAENFDLKLIRYKEWLERQ